MLNKTRGRRMPNHLLMAGIALALGLFLVGLTAARNDVEATDPRTDFNATLARLEAQKNEINALGARLAEDSRLLEIRQHAEDRARAHGTPTWVVERAWDQAHEAGLDQVIVLQLIEVESDLDAALIHTNADLTHDSGLMQLNDRTWPGLAQALGLDNPLDPEQNLRAGIYHLAYLTRKYGSGDKAITAYNRGEAGMEAWVASRGTARSAYSEAVRKGE